MTIRRLFIAEKPDLAKAIRDGLGGGKSQDGYFQCGQDAVTWCFGHMLQLCDPEDYDAKYKKWNMADLPFSHVPWKKKIASDKKDQVKKIMALLKQAREVVHAGDPDDEGQLLIDELLEFAKCTLPVKRVLINDNNLKVVQKALTNLRDNQEFAPLSAAAEARSVGDQLYGYNLTRAYTLKAQNQGHQGVLSVGRVQTPILGLVVRRCRLNASHQKSFYYSVTGDFDIQGLNFNGRYLVKDTDTVDEKKRLLDEVQAKQIAQEATGHTAILASVKTEAKQTPPPLPYNLLKLQTDASRKFGLKPDQVKSITQNLREKYKLITYNRSDCEYLSDEQHGDVPGVLAAIGQTAPIFANLIGKSNPSIKSRAFNSAKVSAHHAIIPTEATADLNKLTDAEQKIYLLIARAYIAQFFPNYCYDRTDILINVGKHQFTASAEVPTRMGWKALYKNDQDNEDLAQDEHILACDLRTLKQHDQGKCIKASAEKKETKPPALYTMATLLSDLTRVAKYVKDERLRKTLVEKDKNKQGEHGGIGTPATRDSIIKTLFDRGFLAEQGKSIVSTPIGEKLYDALPDQAKYPDMTAIWHEQQKALKTKQDVVGFVQNLMTYIGREVESVKQSGSVKLADSVPCPKCTKPMNRIAIPGKQAFWGCSDRAGCKTTLPDAGGKPGQPKPKAAVSAQFKCQACGNGLIRRTGKKGKKAYAFWGCSGYPACKQSYEDKLGKPVIAGTPDDKSFSFNPVPDPTHLV
jgi:DNA topoisomerase III